MLNEGLNKINSPYLSTKNPLISSSLFPLEYISAINSLRSLPRYLLYSEGFSSQWCISITPLPFTIPFLGSDPPHVPPQIKSFCALEKECKALTNF